MKSHVWILAMALWLCPACSTQQDRASQNVDDVSEAARKENAMYQDRVEAKLRDLDQQIDALKTQLHRENKVEHRELAQQMVELDRKRAIAHQKLEKLKGSSEAAWGDMKSGVDAAMVDLDAAYERAASHFD